MRILKQTALALGLLPSTLLAEGATTGRSGEACSIFKEDVMIQAVCECFELREDDQARLACYDNAVRWQRVEALKMRVQLERILSTRGGIEIVMDRIEKIGNQQSR